MDSPATAVAALDPASLAKVLDRLADILHACVSEGASVGFVTPFGRDDARAYWLKRVVPARAAGRETVLIATVGGEVAGTAQLDLVSMPSKRHHAEVSKVLVDPPFRRAGVARALMREIERRAAAEGRWPLTLDTAGDAARPSIARSAIALPGPSRITRVTLSRTATTRRGLCTKTFAAASFRGPIYG